MLTKNEGTIDRAVRVLVGLVLLALAVSGQLGVWAYIGIVPLVTGLMGWCPLYTLLGFSTCPVSGRR